MRRAALIAALVVAALAFAAGVTLLANEIAAPQVRPDAVELDQPLAPPAVPARTAPGSRTTTTPAVTPTAPKPPSTTGGEEEHEDDDGGRGRGRGRGGRDDDDD